MTIPNTILVA